MEIPELALDGPLWRPWEGRQGPHSGEKSRVPSATVEVVESIEQEHQKRLLEFQARMAPLLKTAFDLGQGTSTSIQMLSEFMAMDPAYPHPPTVPSVFYNNFKPLEENPAFKEMRR